MKKRVAYFDRFSISMHLEQARDCSGPGDATEAVTYLEKDKAISRQLDGIRPADIRDCLREYGAWNAEELQDDYENRLRILWIAACDIREEEEGRTT